MAKIEIPCVPFPELPEPLEISLPGGVKLSGFLDFSKGMPTQCSVTFSLLQQLAPVMASLTPILNILNVLMKLKEFLGPPPDPLKAGDVVAAIDKLASLFISLTPAGIAPRVAGSGFVALGRGRGAIISAWYNRSPQGWNRRRQAETAGNHDRQAKRHADGDEPVVYASP